MWKEYVIEREGASFVEVDGGIAFYVLSENSLHVVDLFVTKKVRKFRRYFELMSKLKSIALENQLKFLTGSVRINALNCNEVLRAALIYGWKILETDKTKIELYMEV